MADCTHVGTAYGQSRIERSTVAGVESSALICEVVCERCGAVLCVTHTNPYTPERKDSGT